MATFLPAPTPLQFSTVPSYESAPFVSGFEMAVTGATTLTVQPGMCRALTSSQVIAYPSFSASVPGVITVDVSTVGPNGCYPVSLASLGLGLFTQFPVYACFDTAGTSRNPANSAVSGPGFCVVVATANNFLPAGYDAFRRIGWAYVDDDTLNLIPMIQDGHGDLRTYILQDGIQVVSGSSTAQATVDLSSGDLPIPRAVIGLTAGNRKVLLNAQVAPNAAGGWVSVEPGNATAGSVAPAQVFGSVAAQPSSSMIEMIATPNATTGDMEVKYFVDNGGSVGTLTVIGFEDSLANALI